MGWATVHDKEPLWVHDGKPMGKAPRLTRVSNQYQRDGNSARFQFRAIAI